jgi:hypothetical protein
MPSSRGVRQTVATNTVTISQFGEDTYILSVAVSFTSSATVGNRQLILQVLDSASNVLSTYSAGAVQAASLTNRYNFMPCGAREAAFVNSEINIPIPFDLIVPSGGSIKISDQANIAAGVDTMVVNYNSLSVRA